MSLIDVIFKAHIARVIRWNSTKDKEFDKFQNFANAFHLRHAYSKCIYGHPHFPKVMVGNFPSHYVFIFIAVVGKVKDVSLFKEDPSFQDH